MTRISPKTPSVKVRNDDHVPTITDTTKSKVAERISGVVK
jgi:hypothetical protein